MVVVELVLDGGVCGRKYELIYVVMIGFYFCCAPRLHAKHHNVNVFSVFQETLLDSVPLVPSPYDCFTFYADFTILAIVNSVWSM